MKHVAMLNYHTNMLIKTLFHAGSDAKFICYLRFMPNCLERHSLCTEANWGLPTQHFQKGIIVWVSIKNIINKKKKKKKKKYLTMFSIERTLLKCNINGCLYLAPW